VLKIERIPVLVDAEEGFLDNILSFLGAVEHPADNIHQTISVSIDQLAESHHIPFFNSPQQIVINLFRRLFFHISPAFIISTYKTVSGSKNSIKSAGSGT
jgi:hypothetical protein